jgi:replicative DNA helicase
MAQSNATARHNGRLTDEQRAEVGRRLADWDVVMHGPAPRLRDAEADLETPPATLGAPDRFVDGAAFILDAPEKVPAIWGQDDEVLWPKGEPFLLVGPDGVGKGTIIQQVALGLAGFPRALQFLGQPVNMSPGGVLYVAADRPNQIARSFRRMVEEDDRPMLSAGLSIWRGPLPFDLGSEPDALVPWLAEREERTVIFDSLGAMVRDPASDEAGSGVFRALMHATSEGYEVCALYHPRKPEQGAMKRVQTVADVYGSRWITAGAGSVLYLDGQPGDLIVKARHLKQPAGEVGPLTLRHDHEAGKTELFETPDLIELAAVGITVKDAAASLFDAAEPDPNEIERARRRLDKLADRGDLERISHPGEATVYKTVEAGR